MFAKNVIAIILASVLKERIRSVTGKRLRTREHMCSRSHVRVRFSVILCGLNKYEYLQLLSTLDMIWRHVCYRFDITAAISFLLSSYPVLKTVLQLYEKSLL